MSASGAIVVCVIDSGRNDCARLRTVSIRLDWEDEAVRNVINGFIVARRLRWRSNVMNALPFEGP